MDATHKRLYRIWGHMLDRCRNPNNDNYKHYGGAGVTVCEEWRKYKQFEAWALANGYEDNLTIDRENVYGNYEPSNCRWATVKDQQNNRRNSRLLTYNGETHTLSEWARIRNLPYRTIHKRLELGFPVEKVLSGTRFKAWEIAKEISGENGEEI